MLFTALALGLLPVDMGVLDQASRGPPPPPCRLLSLSGGGSWGAFEAGVIARLLDERGDAFDYERILGVSAGSLNAGLLATQPLGNAGLRAGSAALRLLWSESRTSDVWALRPRVGAKSLLSNAPLRRLLERTLAGRSIQRNVTFGLTSLGTGRPAAVDERELSAQGGSLLVPLMLASSAIPVLFPPVWYNRTLWVDGGIASNVLTVHGVDRCPPGARVELDIVNCLPLMGQLAAAQMEALGLLGIAARSVQVLLQTAFEHQLNFKCADGQTSLVLARVFSPRQSAGIVVPTILDFDHGARLWEAGYAQSAAPDEFYFCI